MDMIAHGYAPTDERVRHAGGAKAVEVGHSGQGVVVRRILDAPVYRHATRGELAQRKDGRIDREGNRLALAAAERLYQDWYRSGMGQYLHAAVLEARGGGRVANAPAYLRAEGAADARKKFRRAMDHLSGRTRDVVSLVVLQEVPLADVGRGITGRTDREQSRAVALDRLQEGLAMLAVHYGLGG